MPRSVPCGASPLLPGISWEPLAGALVLRCLSLHHAAPHSPLPPTPRGLSFPGALAGALISRVPSGEPHTGRTIILFVSPQGVTTGEWMWAWTHFVSARGKLGMCRAGRELRVRPAWVWTLPRPCRSACLLTLASAIPNSLAVLPQIPHSSVFPRVLTTTPPTPLAAPLGCGLATRPSAESASAFLKSRARGRRSAGGASAVGSAPSPRPAAPRGGGPTAATWSPRGGPRPLAGSSRARGRSGPSSHLRTAAEAV